MFLETGVHVKDKTQTLTYYTEVKCSQTHIPKLPLQTHYEVAAFYNLESETSEGQYIIVTTYTLENQLDERGVWSNIYK